MLQKTGVGKVCSTGMCGNGAFFLYLIGAKLWANSYYLFTMKKTLILGASPNPSRYAFEAAYRLVQAGYEIIPVGIKKGAVAGHEIIQAPEIYPDVHTVTLYLGAVHQKEWYDYLLSLKPQRIIFNPGTENPELHKMAQAAGIQSVEACTLVMLSIGNY